MKYFLLLVLTLSMSTLAWSQNNEIDEIKEALGEAENAHERMILRYELAEAYLRVDAEEAEDIGKQAYNAANDQNNNGMAARAAFLVAKAFERQRDDRNTEVWLRTTLNHAKRAGDSDLIMSSVEKRSSLAVKDRNYRRAYEINQEAFTYFSQNGNSISDLEAKFETLRRQIDRDKKNLAQEKDQLEFQVRNLRMETDQLSTDKTVLEQRTSQLSEANKAKTEEIQSKEEELASVSEQKERAEREAKQRTREVNALSEEVAKEQLIAEKAENAKIGAELKAKTQEIYLFAAAGIAGILLLLALLLYSRFAAKKRTAKSLEEKNQQIEEERERSDELLLNILPAPIAEELKTKGKAQARQYKEATVFFSDFINFTGIAEKLTPEELVQELDKCFKGFDFIIGQYDDIEKIKTIGDAYMCASGLNDRKAMPNSMVKAALEMQEFLDEQKQERIRMGKPYFEARIGIHTGPVVAGVVGVKKFAYDIWGDTVNTAARVEANSEAGKVNISETTYGLIKYNFECTHRGKVQAKNKGLLDMYYVERELVAAAV
ncbi:adenylate/guanylate cyclase domain-containing protein [Lewinella cohaerens]|uniref:adenylate/guanylate cyclase domain-containing protein n=1 Tax=Lewinella cohaerens TaxID=70995 RepID=UPI000378C635|nr:adenylate/guanylate cyclase domain-containing protein [Lewinella cohaerens]